MTSGAQPVAVTDPFAPYACIVDQEVQSVSFCCNSLVASLTLCLSSRLCGGGNDQDLDVELTSSWQQWLPGLAWKSGRQHLFEHDVVRVGGLSRNRCQSNLPHSHVSSRNHPFAIKEVDRKGGGAQRNANVRGWGGGPLVTIATRLVRSGRSCIWNGWAFTRYIF